jgi:hypothetical protein
LYDDLMAMFRLLDLTIGDAFLALDFFLADSSRTSATASDLLPDFAVRK